MTAHYKSKVTVLETATPTPTDGQMVRDKKYVLSFTHDHGGHSFSILVPEKGCFHDPAKEMNLNEAKILANTIVAALYVCDYANISRNGGIVPEQYP